MKKRILIIGINYSPELTGIGRYTGDMVNWLIEQGHKVTVVTAFPYYPQWKIQQPYSGKFYKKEISGNGNLTIYRCPLYVPANPTGVKRLIHEGSFLLSAFFVILRLLFRKSHDLTLAIAPPFHLGILAIFYRFFKRTKVVYHIQDLQIDVAKELNMLKQKQMLACLFTIEKYILGQVDILTTISEGIRRKILAKVECPVRLFPNWVDVNNYYPIESRADLRREFGFSKQDKIVMYSGSIGEKQGLMSILNIARTLKTNPDLKFVICGIGPFKDKLQKKAEEWELSNICFYPLQVNDRFNAFLNIADLHLVLQRGDASDLMMPSKLSPILAVGGLVLATAKPGTTLCDVIVNNKMGVVVDPEDDELLMNAIVKCCHEEFDCERMNARRYSELYLDKSSILNQVMNYFNEETGEVKVTLSRGHESVAKAQA